MVGPVRLSDPVPKHRGADDRAGGGSLAWIDDAGSLRNGPQSAGADPGPACYGQGGTEPTNTDANLVLGRLGDELIAGAMTLDSGKAEEALRKVAEPLDLGVTEAAEAVIAVANANMADAIRLISVRRGYDPREFALVCFGGAGPLHGAALARELAIPTVLVPPTPGPPRRSAACWWTSGTTSSRCCSARSTTPTPSRSSGSSRSSRRRRWSGCASRVSPDKVDLQRTIDMRYAGQWRSIAVPVDGKVTSLDDLAGTFEDEHDREHSYRREGSPIEIYRLNLRAVGVTQKAELARHEREGSMPEPIARRQVHFGDGDAHETPVYRRADVPAGATFAGPAVLEQLDSTVLVPPGAEVEVDDWLNIRMAIEEEGDEQRPDDARPGHLRGAEERLRDHRRPDGGADPPDLPLVRDLLARFLIRPLRPAGQHDHAGKPGHRGPRRHPPPHRPGGGQAFKDEMRPGDVFAINDPYVGGTHFNDVRIVRPIFHDGKLICIAESNGHWADMGQRPGLLRRQRQGPLR